MGSDEDQTSVDPRYEHLMDRLDSIQKYNVIQISAFLTALAVVSNSNIKSVSVSNAVNSYATIIGGLLWIFSVTLVLVSQTHKKPKGADSGWSDYNAREISSFSRLTDASLFFSTLTTLLLFIGLASGVITGYYGGGKSYLISSIILILVLTLVYQSIPYISTILPDFKYLATEGKRHTAHYFLRLYRLSPLRSHTKIPWMEVIDYRIIEAVQQEDQAQRVDQISKKVGKSIELTEKRCELLLNKGLLDRDMYKQYEVSDLGRRFMDGLASEKELRN